VVTLLVLTALLAIESQGTAGPAGAEAQVRAAEAARVEATVANDFEALDRLLGDDLTYTHTNAQIDTKQTFLAALRTGRTRYQSIEPSDVQVRMYGQVAILNGLAKVRFLTNGQPGETSLRFTSAWHERDGRWQFVAWQSTRLPQ
jgi:ketosteroid isomerase-like protein